ncbi:MAG: tyrosine-type recombinase/integrase [Armatimonadetes bacterium]|nr:tyrosine-type recombinase/integrase [Armatimonadota bacterium]
MSSQDRLRRFLEWLGPRRDGPRLVGRVRRFLSFLGDDQTLDPPRLRAYLAEVSAGNQRQVREAMRRWLRFQVAEEHLSPESARRLLYALRKEPPRRVSSFRASPPAPVLLDGEWPELLAEYRLELRRRLRDWKQPFRHAVRFMLSLGRTGKTVAEVRASLLEVYLLTLQEDSLRERGRVLHPRTLRQHLVDIRRWMAHLLSRGKVWQDPTRQLELPRIPRRLPRVLTYSQVKRLLELPDPLSPLGLRDRAFLELLYGCGLRRGELQRLNLLDLDLSQALLTIRREKSGGGRVVPLGRWVSHHLENYLVQGRPQLESSPGQPALWLSQYGNRLGTGDFQRRLAVYRAELDFPVTLHGLRHSCATHLLEGGAGLPWVAFLLGHRDLASTQLYTRVRPLDLQRMLRSCHPRG